MDDNLKEKVEHEIARIGKLINDAKPLLDLCRIRTPDFIEITAAAQILHSFYNGVESVIMLLLKSMDEKTPNDSRWHKTLFEITFGLNSKNMMILREDLKGQLEKYMYFRHFIRHSYSSELEWSEMETLIKNLEGTWEMIKTDLEAFIGNK